nr:hypothetical protein [Candidatus Sigynarchaeum springense]MDO8118787.1 DUF2281 domain-containing protein [Candidatus Sigynarchaeota archaeon]
MIEKKRHLLDEIEGLPDSSLDEVLDFVRFMKFKLKSVSLETALLSEPALKKDWERPEEDRAWSKL